MKRLFLVLLCLAFWLPSNASMVRLPYVQDVQAGMVIGSGSGGDYCSSITWNTISDFTLDFSHPTDARTACGTDEVGVLTTATIATPAIASPGSGGDALYVAANTSYIQFDNTGSPFTSQYGEIISNFQISGDGSNNDFLFNIVGVPAQDRMEIYVHGSTGRIYVTWEDNNNGTIDIYSGDVDAFYGDWIQIHVKWDTTRCTDGTCDGVGEDELAIRTRVDDNRDGDFADGGAEDWTAWTYETSAVDMGAWATEPGENDIYIGIYGTTYTQDIYIDDVEISNDKPSW